MYDKIRPAKQGHSAGFRVAVTLVVLVLLVGTAVFAWGVHYRLRYREFVSHLSNSNVYAYENRSLHADVDGTLVWAKSDNVQGLYNYILLNGSGRTCGVPEGDPVIYIEYGDGGTLKIYEAEQEGFYAYLLYEHTDGFRYGYASSKLTVDTFRVTYLSLKDNAPWAYPLRD